MGGCCLFVCVGGGLCGCVCVCVCVCVYVCVCVHIRVGEGRGENDLPLCFTMIISNFYILQLF